MLLVWTSLILITRVAAVPIPWPKDYQRNATYGLDTDVCVADDIMFRSGEVVPPISPCHECVCRPPNLKCQLIPCEKKVGCRTIQLSDQCCPQYQCECESNGRVYNNGEKLEAPESPCKVCYCRGGQIVCTLIQCYQRDDCKPQQVPGRCCPKYDHCPPLDNRISSLHSTGWPTMLTTSFLPEAPSTPGQRQHPSVTSRNENTIFFETSASDRFELLGEPPRGFTGSSHKTTDSPDHSPRTFTVLEETYEEYSTERSPASLQPSTGEAHEGGSGLSETTGAGTDLDDGSTVLSEDSTIPFTETGEAREGESNLLATTLEPSKHSTGADERLTDGRTPLEVTTNNQEQDTTPAVENTTFLEKPSTVKDEVRGEPSTLVENSSSSDDPSTVELQVYEENSTRADDTQFSKHSFTVTEDKREEESTHLQDKSTLSEDLLQSSGVQDEVRNSKSDQSQDTTSYPYQLNNSSETKQYNESRISSVLHNIGTTEGSENVTVTLIDFEKKTTLSPLTDFVTERFLLPTKGEPNELSTEEETATTQHSQNEDNSRENHGDLEEENTSESTTGSEATNPLDMIAEESEHSLAGKPVRTSGSRTDSTDIQNNISLETSQDPWSNSITNSPESSVSGNNYSEVGVSESSAETAVPTDRPKVSSTYPTTFSNDTQVTTDAADLQTSDDAALGSLAEGTSMEKSSSSKTKLELESTLGSLPQGDESGMVVADKSEETWEHHRPTQMVTDEIQYITTVNPMKDRSEGENVFTTFSGTDNEPHSRHRDQTMAPPSLNNTGDTLSTRFRKLGETEYTTSQPKEGDLKEPSQNTESEMTASWDATEQSDSLHSKDSSTESVSTEIPAYSNGYDESGESTRYVKLGEVVSQTGTHILESEETVDDDFQSNTPQYNGLLESENKTITSMGKEVNDETNGGVTDKIESKTSEEIATGSETTVSPENVQGFLLNNTSLTSTENQLQGTHTTILPTDSPYGNPEENSEKSKDDTILPVEPKDEHIAEITSKPFQASTSSENHHLPTTTLDQDNAPLPIFKLSEEMSNHQMVVEIHHITSATVSEDSAEETMLNTNDSRDKTVIEKHTNKYPTEVTGKENTNTNVQNVSITEEAHSSQSTNKESGENGQKTTDTLNQSSEQSTAAGDVQENTTTPLDQQGATETVSDEQQAATKTENTSSEKTDATNQTDFDDSTAESVTGSEVTEASGGVESTTMDVPSSITSQDFEREMPTEHGETNENLNYEQTEQLFESEEAVTTTGNTERSVTVTEIGEGVEQTMTSDKPRIGSSDSPTEAVIDSQEKNATNEEDNRTDSNSSFEDYTLSPETTSSFEGNLEVSTGNQESETSTLVSNNESQESAHNILHLNSKNDAVGTERVTPEQETTTQVTEQPHIESDTESSFTVSIDDTTDIPVTTAGHNLPQDFNVTNTDIVTPSASLIGTQQDTFSELEDTLVFQSNKTNVENNSRPEHESATEIEHHLKFQSNKTSDPESNNTANGTTNVNFVLSLPTGWLKDNQTEENVDKVSTTETLGPGELSTFYVSGSVETHTPMINTYQPGTSYGSAVYPEERQPEESIYTRLQREDAEELGKYDLETLQNFFKNLYIQDDHADVSNS